MGSSISTSTSPSSSPDRQTIIQKDRTKSSLSTRGLGKSTRRGFIRFISIISSVVIGIAGGMWLYFWYGSTVYVPSYHQERIDRIHDRELAIQEHVLFNAMHVYHDYDFTKTGSDTVLTQILHHEDLHYVHKKNISQEALHMAVDSIVETSDAIDSLQRDIALYGFFPSELSQLFAERGSSSSLQDSLVSLETIRFAAATNVFVLLNSFVNSFAAQSGLSESYIQDQIRLYIARGDGDIANFLRMCYLNPFESLDDCSMIGDFSLYFQYTDPHPSFDTALFIGLMNYVQKKLEEDNFSNLLLTFDRFDPNNDRLSFTATINTTINDRQQLEQEGILAPQVFIVKQLVHLLQQSTFVLGSNIDINQLDIRERMVDVTGKPDVIFTTDLRFSLPLQPHTQREIFDFSLGESFNDGL